MNEKPPVELRKGRNGEKIFAVALFLTLIVAAAVTWFVVGPKGRDANEMFQDAHERYVQAASDAVLRYAYDFEVLATGYAASLPKRIEIPPEAESVQSLARRIGVFAMDGRLILPASDVVAAQNPALKSAGNSPHSYDILYARSPFTGEPAVLFTAAFDQSGETFVLVMEAEDVFFSNTLLIEEPERRDELYLVTHDGSVIATNQAQPVVTNLIQWAEAATPTEDMPPLYVSVRDRIAGFSTYDSAGGAFRLGFSPVSGTDWMLAQVEFVE